MPFGNSEGAEDEEASASIDPGTFPTNVDTAPSPGPTTLIADPSDEEPLAVIGEAPSTEGERVEDPPPPPLPEFDPKWRMAFEGLCEIGRLMDEFDFLGHHFVIRTLSTDEVLQTALLQKPYAESMADLRAYTAVMVAACVVSVDGKELPQPITTDIVDTALRNRFEYVRQSWYPVVIDVVYDHYLNLEATVAQVVAKMGEALG